MKNFRKRLVPKLKELSEILLSSVTVPDKDGNYHFYDELSSSTRAVEFGDGIYQLHDLGDLVSELSINYTEYTGSEDKEAIKNARNEYTDICVDILNILSDKDVLYHKSTDSKAKTTPQSYRRNSSGNKYLVQILRSDSFVPKIQVPVKMIFPDGEYGLGQIEFVFDENGIGHAVNYIPGMQKREYTVGLIPISDKVFDGAVINLNLNAESVSGMGNSFDYQISSDIKLTNDETRGLTLEKTPLNEIDGILGYDYEYYIKDIYGNETVLSVNDDIPVLRNIANAKITDEGVKYGTETLEEGKDYEKYEFEGGVIYFGIGSYTGHRMIQDEPSYKEKQINVYRESMDENETVGVRFYENTPNVPYVGIKQFYDTFMLGDMKTELTGDFTYTLTSDGGQTAVLDAGEGVLTIKDFDGFVALPKLISGSGNTLSYGLAPYLQFDREEVLRKSRTVSIDIGKYGIDIYGNDDDVYLPLAALNDIFENGKNFRVEYNGKNIYVVDGSNIIYPASAKNSDPDYDLNFAVLTSKATFSSANLLASLLHENGIPVIGEQSSGGSCSVMAKPTPDGWEYTHSSYTRLADAELNNIDGGVPVDIPIVKTNADGSKDYSAYVDIAQLSAKINEYYGNAGDENPATGTEIPVASAFAALALVFVLRKRERTR